MASTNIARLGVVLGLDMAEFSAQLDKSISETKKFASAVDREAKIAAKEIQSLKHAVEDYGKEVSYVTKMQRDLHDVTGRYYNLAKSKPDFAVEMLKEAAAMDAKIVATKKLNAVNLEGMKQGMNAQQKAALGYQTTDIITGLAGGQNPLLVMIQQGGQLRDQFGGFKPLFAGIAQAVTLSGVAMTAFGAALAGVGYAYYKGAEEQKQFQRDMILTGKYAGLNEGAFNSLSLAISNNARITIGDSKDILSALTSSGQFTYKTMSSVAEAIANVSRISGESADVVAKNLIPSFDGTAQSAKRLNDQYHFLTFEQYKYIENLQLQGKTQEAMIFTADKFNESLKNQTIEVGYLGRAWKFVSTEFSSFLNSMMEWGKSDTASSIAENLRKELEAAAKAANDRSIGGGSNEAAKKRYDDLKAQYVKAKQDEIAEAVRLQKESDDKAAEQKKIKLYEAAGGAKKAMDLQADYEKLKADQIFQEKMFNANEMEKFRLESAKRIADKEIQIAKENNQQIGQFSGQQAKILAQFKLNEELTVNQQIQDLNRKTLNTYKEQQATTRDSLEMEKQKMGVYQEQFFVSQADAKIAEDRLKTQQEIAKIQRDLAKGKLTGEGAAELIKEQEGIQKTREEVDLLATKMQYVKDVNNAVFQSMTQAIQAFLITGKLSFKDFATSVIASILQVQAQWMAMQAMRGLGSVMGMFGAPSTSAIMAGTAGAGGFTGIGGASFSLPVAAAGGFVNSPTLVGENGPELFVPQGAGTIIPNQQMSNMGNQPSVVYNGPYIANMQAIDTQSGVQFLAKNKMTIWSMNQSANRSIPASR